MSALLEANELINGEKAEAYGDVTEEFGKVADLWSVIAGVELSPMQCLLMMSQLKVVRQLQKHNPDNIVDACGYIGLIEKVKIDES